MKDEKMKDREMWMDKLKEKLENYSEPIPPFGWEQPEKELVPPVKKEYCILIADGEQQRPQCYRWWPLL